MDTLHYLALLVSILLIIYQSIQRRNKAQYKNLPPSPPGLPIIGHFHLLKIPMTRTVNNLFNKYGPILLLRFGSRLALVVSSQSAIEECLTKNDVIFANLPMFPSRENVNTFAGLGVPYGELWRNLRRAYVLEVFSPRRLLLSASIRAEEIRIMAKNLFQGSSKGEVQKVDVKFFLYKLGYDIIMRMVDGKRCFEKDERDVATGKLIDLVQTFAPVRPTALGDYFPYLRWLACFGVERKMRKLIRKREDFVQAMLDEHRNSYSSVSVNGGKIGDSLIDTLLKQQESEPEFYTDDMIKGMVEALLIAGPHTTVLIMELVISRLFSHPEVFKTAREEIDKHVGQSKLLEEADVSELQYLHGVINETMRLEELTGVLPDRESSKECTVGGYRIPAGTLLLINAWAVHKDPELWEDPEKFKPERFLQGVEEHGAGCKFLPFGSGRRQCPGSGLAMRLMALAVGTLIQCFEWEKAEEMPLKVIFRHREDLTKVLAQL